MLTAKITCQSEKRQFSQWCIDTTAQLRGSATNTLALLQSVKTEGSPVGTPISCLTACPTRPLPFSAHRLPARGRVAALALAHKFPSPPPSLLRLLLQWSPPDLFYRPPGTCPQRLGMPGQPVFYCRHGMTYRHISCEARPWRALRSRQPARRRQESRWLDNS